MKRKTLFPKKKSFEILRSSFTYRPRRLEALIGFLENKDNDDVQMAIAGLLANLSKLEREITMKLIELGGLDAIISVLKIGKMEAKKYALSALFRFTDPTNIESRCDLVKRGICPLLLDFLNTSSVTGKARITAIIGDLSMSTPKLTIISKPTGCWFFKSSHVPLCSAHGSVCSGTNSIMAEAVGLLENVFVSKEMVEYYRLYRAKKSTQKIVEDHVKDLKKKAIDVSKAITVSNEIDEVTIEYHPNQDESYTKMNIFKENIIIKASVCCDDQLELFPKLIQVLKRLRLNS
ncbi:hypothetical protein VNO77_41780 [Canavalia gladiata]|uniref:Uncharacterized protein n=1 Tax=Canavalia gladiata TaxID=3824 RepID=A0AAN9PRU5_CANGL